MRHALERVHAILEVRGQGLRARQQTLFGIGIQRAQRRGAGERMPGVGIAVEEIDAVARSLHEGIVDPLLHDHPAHRHGAAGNALGEGDEIGRDAEILARKRLAQAAEAGNHLVEYQQDAVLVANLAQALQIALRRDQHAARTRHRLDDHRGDVGGIVQRDDALLQLVGELGARGRLAARKCAARRIVRVAQVIHSRNHHAVGLAVGGHATDGNAGEVDAVIAALASDEARARALALQAVVGERDFQRRVHSLGAGIDEEHLLHALGREPGDAARDFERQRMAERER